VIRLAAIPVLVLAAAAPAAAFVEQIERRGDLDGDAASETVRVRPFGPPSGYQRTQVRVSDSCPAAVDRRIAPIHDNLEKLRLRRADRRKGNEVFLVLRDGAKGALGEARLVAWRRQEGQPCRRPKALFVYDTDRHTRTPKGGNGDIAYFNANIRNISRRFKGPEIAIDERFVRPSDPPGAGSIKKITYWRYSAKRDRYLHFLTLVRRLG
jgi:hypothetical protein